MTPGPAGGVEESIVALRLILVSLDDDTDADARNDAINVIASEVGESEERWRVIALSTARLAALFATGIHGSPASEEARAKARASVQKLVVAALDQRRGPGK
jgi:hypothetical protein